MTSDTRRSRDQCEQSGQVSWMILMRKH